MRTLSAADLLSVWERGRNREPVQQAIELLAAASPNLSREGLLRLRIGQRDAALLMLREATFGPQMRSVVECPCCNTRRPAPRRDCLRRCQLRFANSPTQQCRHSGSHGGEARATRKLAFPSLCRFCDSLRGASRGIAERNHGGGFETNKRGRSTGGCAAQGRLLLLPPRVERFVRHRFVLLERN